jgi:hypothetical protein
VKEKTETLIKVKPVLVDETDYIRPTSSVINSFQMEHKPIQTPVYPADIDFQPVESLANLNQTRTTIQSVQYYAQGLTTVRSGRNFEVML